MMNATQNAFTQSFTDPAPLPERLGHKVDETLNHYPVEALGEVLAPMAKDLNEVIKAPIALCGQSVLMASALVAQGFKNIEIDNRVFPVSLFSLIIGESGERKTAVDKFAMQPIKAYEFEKQQQYKEEIAAWRIKKEAHAQAKKNIIAAKKKENNPDAIEFELKKLGAEPMPPLSPTLTSKDATIEGVVKHLRQSMPSLGIFSDEGGVFFGGHSMSAEKVTKTIALYSQAWDGSELDMMRSDADVGAFKLYNRRISINLMVQPVIAKAVFSDPLLIQQGFIPRFLISEPISTMGTRLYNHEQITERSGYKRYFSRIKSLLDKGIFIEESGGLDLMNLTISNNAKPLFIAFHDEIEKQLSKDGELRHISGTAAKIAEQALRIAGVLTVINSENQAKCITPKEMQSGIDLARYSLNQLIRMSEKALISKEVENARKLLNWIAQNRFKYIYSSLQANNRPNALRPKEAYQDAVITLTEHGYLYPEDDGMELDGGKRKEVYKVVHYFEPEN